MAGLITGVCPNKVSQLKNVNMKNGGYFIVVFSDECPSVCCFSLIKQLYTTFIPGTTWTSVRKNSILIQMEGQFVFV